MSFDEKRERLQRYCEGNTSPEDTRLTIEELENNKALREEYALMQQLQGASEHWQDQEVPNWQRTRYIAKATKHTPFWPWFSVACSATALILVLLQVNVQTVSDGVYIGVGQPMVRPELSSTKEVNSPSNTQWHAYLNARLEEFEYQQNLRNQDTLNASVELSRQERHRETNQWVNYLQEQRASDLQRVSNVMRVNSSN
jgi:hypothetical protein